MWSTTSELRFCKNGRGRGGAKVAYNFRTSSEGNHACRQFPMSVFSFFPCRLRIWIGTLLTRAKWLLLLR
jgi:hypothetical protein